MSAQEMNERLDSLRGTYREQQQRLHRELNEIEVLMRQNAMDIEKLAQRELTVSNRVRDLEVNLEKYSKAEIKNFFAAAQEVQMRLQGMRAQMEQLKARQEAMRTQQNQMSEVIEVLNELIGSGSNGVGGGITEEVSNDTLVANIMQAHENELLRISLQLHDGPVQVMSNLVLRAEICQRMLDRDVEQSRTELASLKTAITNALQQGRGLIFDLRPMTLDDLGLVPTIRRYATQISERAKIEVDVLVQNFETRLPNHYEVAVFRFIQEAMKNVEKHSQATQARIFLSTFEETLQIVVEDDGVGFHVEEAVQSNNRRRSMGIASMRQRIEVMLRGEFGIESTIGQGTRVAATIPLV